jgi:hypothetical protein
MRALAEALPAVPREAGFDEDIWGAVPSRRETEHARSPVDGVREARLRQALEGALTRAEAAQWLGITPQAVSRRRENKTLTALRRGREWYFPRWQFTEDETLPGLEELIRTYRGTPLSLSVWANTANPDLNHETPANHMREHGAEALLSVIRDARGALW